MLSQADERNAATSATGLDVFDTTIHLTDTWLDEMMETLPRDKQLAWHQACLPPPEQAKARAATHQQN